MSRYEVNGACGSKKATVVLGWDPPVQHFFVDVWKAGSKARRSFYTSMVEPKGGVSTIEGLKQKLAQLGVTVPEATFSQVAQDRAGRWAFDGIARLAVCPVRSAIGTNAPFGAQFSSLL